MTPLIVLPPENDEPVHPRSRARIEADLFAGRVHSARKWRRRRFWLRLRADLFGRAKLRPGRERHGEMLAPSAP